ncbi:hypothetical protein CspeluHIS016_0802940 [Cutaneotrichosporon spelunceum]|uniref:ubiquitinyl hydrolase 1 n=1 Tax=Cutaneotrichosporon spelunceum TaxID=1672016 RepID=A0AAD3TZL7_9TREE|nr:hypothetical protein CspeluHIS016_0802940 [Cutaneotrichosporon spelunceum]
MPPKKHPKDWSWCDLVTSSDDITLEHRRLSAGLHPSNSPKVCTIPSRGYTKFKSQAKGTRRGNGKRAISWWKDDALETFLQSRMGEEIRERGDSGPPGLRNYGATCYANAFLQVWFHNVSFRNGVFEAVGDRVNPLFYLAKIFAAMRYTLRQVVDPGALIEALRLDKGAQQDAAEFSKLFMDLIEKQFKAQGGPLADFVAEQFTGQLEYRTECNTCGYTSSTTSPFMELEVPLQDGCSLEGQLTRMLTPELLDGDNKYRCPQCSSLQPATRSSRLQRLPPALHFALNRFEYTPTSDERKKSKARISYPRKLRLENVDYDLHGVVVHEGPKATQGHFTAEVYDENDKQWYFCSDGEVCNLSERPKKKIKLDPDMLGEQVSRDAYMLVYQRSRQPPPQRHAPEHLRKEIRQDNDEFLSFMGEQFDKRQTLCDAFNVLVREKEAVLKLLPGDDCIVPRECLSEWFASDRLRTKWIVPNNLKCYHGRYDPNASGFRLISRAAFERLKSLYDGEWDDLLSEHSPNSQAMFSFLQGHNDVTTGRNPEATVENGVGALHPSIASQDSHLSFINGSDKENVPPVEESTGNVTPDPDDRRSGTLPVGNAVTSDPVPDKSDSDAKSSPSESQNSSSLSGPLPTNGTLDGLLSSPSDTTKTALPSSDTSISQSSLRTTNRSRFRASGTLKDEAHVDDINRNDDNDDVLCISLAPEFPELDICPVCVRKEYERKAGDSRQAELLLELNRANEHGGPYLLPQAWLDAWTTNKLSPDVLPTDPQFSLFCKHDKPFLGDKKPHYVSEEFILLLRSVLDEFPVFDEEAEMCRECSAAEDVAKNQRAAWLTRVKVEEKLFKNQRNQSHVFGLENYLLPRTFFEQWERYLKDPVERPILQVDRCPHGLLDFDPGLDNAEYDFPPQEGIKVKYDSQPVDGKRLPVVDSSLATCEPCRIDRFSNWKQMWLPIVVGENVAPSNSDGTKRRAPPRGRRGKEAQILVTKNMSIMDVQLELYDMFKIPPFSQQLLFQGRELDRQETIGGIGVLIGDHLNLIEVIEVDDDIEMVAGDEGFGGTALVGQNLRALYRVQ